MNDDIRFFRIVAQLAESYHKTDGQPVLPGGCRDHIIAVLEHVIIDPTVLDLYWTELSMMELDRPGLDETYTLTEDTLQAILDGRWEEIEDATLGTLVLRPRALRSIARRVGEEPSYHWLKVYDREEEREAESVDSDETTGAKKTTTTRATKDSERIHQAGDDLRAEFPSPWQWAIAASLLLVGGMIGYFAHPGGLDGGQIVIAQARAEASFRPTRGSDDPVPHIRITSPFAGYAVVVSLADGRRPIVVPYVGADDIEVPLDDTTFHPLPDDTKSAVFVVTPTPAGEAIRRIESTTLQGLESGQEDAVRNAVQQQLESKGYRRMAFGKAQFDNP